MTTWHGDELDLEAYFVRIGFDGERLPSAATLAALHRAHTTSIPFENLEIMLGRPIVLDLDTLQNKMIRRQRGGYCYEHVTLFAAALERLGFRFTALAGRVTLGAETKRPRTHALIVVEFDDDRRWLCDVGFGRGPLEPIELIAGNEVEQDGWQLRLSRAPLGADTEVFHPDEWTLWQRSSVDGTVGWLDRHVFTLDPQYPIDYAVANHFVSTSPRSPFTTRPFVQRFAADVQHVLDGTTWTTTSPDGSSFARDVEISDVPTLLADTFGVDLSSDDAAGLVAWMRTRT
ncbi:arylamine N-acetyltransferase family protein [Mycolicibacterium mucogenicum]|uniref:Acetyltransferase n=1 Tax=Mycolicibacterium mucogenicum DSM 44124 TaxID=1226753 RepID=A0A8H2PJM5_MYCMU|nr:arylamine N-acetyltransferase [Mycolicibacterium mucogenicum]KAB7755985.1 acetyltransferase [Mycolicibacterium mucogenicum DSM 44124]QPG69404.1 arylamine N-acetyltransferase [Mycolicibacterium mucogenicum DSM 44124]